MSSVEDYHAWRRGAEAVAERADAEAWRAKPEELTRTREAGKALELVPLLREALYRHLGELADPRLYARTPLGTKHLVEAFYEEALACIAYLADPDQTGLSPSFTLAGFRRAAHIFGRSGLRLSGGATLGFWRTRARAVPQASAFHRRASAKSQGCFVITRRPMC